MKGCQVVLRSESDLQEGRECPSLHADIYRALEGKVGLADWYKLDTWKGVDVPRVWRTAINSLNRRQAYSSFCRAEALNPGSWTFFTSALPLSCIPKIHLQGRRRWTGGIKRRAPILRAAFRHLNFDFCIWVYLEVWGGGFLKGYQLELTGLTWPSTFVNLGSNLLNL